MVYILWTIKHAVFPMKQEFNLVQLAKLNWILAYIKKSKLISIVLYTFYDVFIVDVLKLNGKKIKKAGKK